MQVQFRIRLSDVDRERYDCKEWLEFDLRDVTAWEAALIQRGFTRDGIRVAFDSPRLWASALPGEIVTDENGEEITDPVTEDGKPLLDDKGAAIRVPRRRPDMGAEMILVWLALRHNGTDVPMAEIDYQTSRMQWQIVREEKPEEELAPGESEGKDDADSPPEPLNIPISAT